jgi:hypothetical protein
VDEFQDFATENFIQTVAQSRKYKLPLVLAHQQLAQLPASLRACVLTNCKLQAYFQISRADADILAKESLSSVYRDPPGWEWYIQQLQELRPWCCVMKNKVDGDVMKIHSLRLPDAHDVVGEDARTFYTEVAEAKIGEKYLRSRAEVEEEYQKRREELFKRVDTENFREMKK